MLKFVETRVESTRLRLLTLEYEGPLSDFAFNLTWRPYTMAPAPGAWTAPYKKYASGWWEAFALGNEAGAVSSIMGKPSCVRYENTDRPPQILVARLTNCKPSGTDSRVRIIYTPDRRQPLTPIFSTYGGSFAGGQALDQRLISSSSSARLHQRSP